MSTNYHIDHGLKRRRGFSFYALALVVCIITVVSGYSFISPSQPEKTNRTSPALITPKKPEQTITTTMPWPNYGHAAYKIKENNQQKVASSDNNADIVPIASLAKVITALAVLEKKPLKPGDSGPTITLSDQDATLYAKYLHKNGAVLPATAGQKISQHDALRAMLMVSANNVSDILVRWAFDSMDNYTEYANNMVRDMGLTKTTVADASGFSPLTVSTAEEMTQLGILYMEHPVLREITLQKQANIPIFGTIQNHNYLADGYDMSGIKVGDTDEAGRCFMAADINGDFVSVAVVLGAKDFNAAVKDAEKIIKAGNKADSNLGDT